MLWFLPVLAEYQMIKSLPQHHIAQHKVCCIQQ